MTAGPAGHSRACCWAGLGCLILLSGCASGNGDTAQSTSESPSSQLTITAAALCEMATEHLDHATDLVISLQQDTQKFYNNGGLTKIRDVLVEIEHARSVAPPEFHASLDVVIEKLHELAEYLSSGGGEMTLESRNFIAANTDIGYRCLDALE